MARDRDIDYAAVAVRKAIVEKFKTEPLEDLRVVAGERTISVEHQGRVAVQRNTGLTPIVAADQHTSAIDDHAFRVVIFQLPKPLIDVDALRFEVPGGMYRS